MNGAATPVLTALRRRSHGRDGNLTGRFLVSAGDARMVTELAPVEIVAGVSPRVLERPVLGVLGVVLRTGRFPALMRHAVQFRDYPARWFAPDRVVYEAVDSACHACPWGCRRKKTLQSVTVVQSPPVRARSRTFANSTHPAHPSTGVGSNFHDSSGSSTTPVLYLVGSVMLTWSRSAVVTR